MPVYALGSLEPTIHPDAFVHPDAVVIGAAVIGPEASIWPTAVLRADNATITVGARTSVQDGTVIHCTEELPTTIGADCVVGHNAHLEGCVVEDGALVGSGSVLLHRVVVRSGALVAAGAVVAPGTEVPSGAIAMGVPARIRAGAADAEAILRNAAVYVAAARTYRRELRRLD
ncbi:MAG TPA: gamma carbonic anhydrase family protein [Actinomycetes bacterium]|nr:gamma carbonic anhydrase family protein [Actinomycetes bacterium]